MNSPTTVVRLENISKSFGPVQANAAICLNIRATRILALLGENGAGKSTLMSILAGKSRQDSGTIYIDGQPSLLRAPKDALAAGIGMVYQHFMLVEAMTVTENLALGQGGWLLQPQAMRAKVVSLSDKYGLFVNPDARIADLSMGERQRVEILKLLLRNCRVLILDEPTAVLTPPEIDQLFMALKRMAAEGKAIVFISHKMREVLQLAHEIAILRRGAIVDFFQREEVPNERELATRMLGTTMNEALHPKPVPQGETVLQVENLCGQGMENLCLSLHRGEVLAVLGVAGNGQRELVEVLAGLRKAQGQVTLLGKSLRKWYHSKISHGNGLVYIPEDRKGRATCPNLDLVDNFLLTNRFHFLRGPFLNYPKARAAAKAMVAEYQVSPGNLNAVASSLSGGNLQKLVIGRELYRQPHLIIAENPTQGLDIAAMEEVWRRLLAAREQAGILLVTSDLSEASLLADTFAVIYRGRFMDIFSRNDTEKMKTIGLLMAGIQPNSPEQPAAMEALTTLEVV